MPKTFGFIFARGGSKGVPRKNLRLVGGKPLVAHAIETARAVGRIERIIVSTEDKEIAQVARDFGAEVPALRPAELASDAASEWLAWKHAVEVLAGGPFDLCVSVPATTPLKAPADVDACIDAYLAGSCDMVITGSDPRCNPYYNMFTCDAEGYARVVIPPEGRVTRRQDAPACYQLATVAYVTTPDFIRRAEGVLAGRTKAVVVPFERALDIDTPLDLEFVEFLWNRRAAAGARAPASTASL